MCYPYVYFGGMGMFGEQSGWPILPYDLKHVLMVYDWFSVKMLPMVWKYCRWHGLGVLPRPHEACVPDASGSRIRVPQHTKGSKLIQTNSHSPIIVFLCNCNSWDPLCAYKVCGFCWNTHLGMCYAYMNFGINYHNMFAP
jgi:hypothetical protein